MFDFPDNGAVTSVGAAQGERTDAKPRLLSNSYVRSAAERLRRSRIRLLSNHGFFGILLMHQSLQIDPSCQSAATNGELIVFGSDFLDSLNDKELDFVMMHEVMHTALLHHLRNGQRNNSLFNVACDIVVNAVIMQELGLTKPLSLAQHGEVMWKTPSGKSGHLYTAEEVYQELLEKFVCEAGGQACNLDDHSMWPGEEDGFFNQAKCRQRVMAAAEAACKDELGKESSSVPLIIKKMLSALREPQIDWRTVLNDFVQEETTDYTFVPPDRRMHELDFFLPDFNEKDFAVKNLLFYIDTSGSINNEEIAAAYAEIAGALEQFNGRLEGRLSFFDTKVSAPAAFSDVDEVLNIKPRGGGGTCFHVVMQHLDEIVINREPPACAIILTDGFAEFPPAAPAHGVSVLWVINNNKRTPPWGRTARIKVQ